MKHATSLRRKWSVWTWLGLPSLVSALLIVAGVWTFDQWLNPRLPPVAINAIIDEDPVEGPNGKVRVAQQPTGTPDQYRNVPAAYTGEALSLHGLAMCAAWPPQEQ